MEQGKGHSIREDKEWHWLVDDHKEVGTSKDKDGYIETVLVRKKGE